MDPRQKIAIVVPCYNESRRFRGEDFLNFARDHRQLVFLFVDDGSTDTTRELLTALVGREPEQLRLIALPRNLGKAEAVRLGMVEAIGRQFGTIGYWDADQATPLTAILALAATLRERGAQAVFASRVRLLGRQIDRGPLRHYLGRAFATCVSLMLGLAVYDTQCGAKLFVNDPILAAIVQSPFVSRWIFDVEIIARYRQLGKDAGTWANGQTIVEYPLEQWSDVAGSKLRGADFLKAALDLLRIGRHYGWRQP